MRIRWYNQALRFFSSFFIIAIFLINLSEMFFWGFKQVNSQNNFWHCIVKQGRGSLIDTKYFRHAQNFKSYLRRNACSKNRAEHEQNWNFSPLQFCLVFLQYSSKYIFTGRVLGVRQCPESSSRKPSEQLRYSCYKVPPIRWLTCSIISSRRFYKRKKQNIIPFQEVQSNLSYSEHPRDLY